MSRYDHRYDAFRYGAGPMAGGWYPGAFWAGAPVYGWSGMDIGWPPYLPVGYGGFPAGWPPRRRPEESPAYGRDGDRYVREWAARRGYDSGYAIRPRLEGPRPYDRGYRRYDRPYDRGW